ncbi:MAG: hypothetical protein ABSE17_00390 [Candidatus Levyibacteriota bacterium]|jgi:hypothetical protein
MESPSEASFYKPRVSEVYDKALKEHPSFKTFSQDEIRRLIRTSVDEIAELEAVGEKDKARFEVSTEILQNIGAIWVLSGPGTFDSPTKEDSYNHLSWARWMDRERLNHAAILARKVAEVKSGEGPAVGFLDTIQQRIGITKRMIEQYGPQIVYNGTKLEDDTVASVLGRRGVIIPRDKVDIRRGDIKITLDQIRDFELPEGFSPNQELAIISHAPQLLRVTHMLNAAMDDLKPPFPPGTKIRLFPVPTQRFGQKEYATMEVMGLLKYHYLDRVATIDPYPYQVS